MSKLFIDLQYFLAGISGLIPQSLQLQEQVALASVGWCPKSGESAQISVFLQSEWGNYQYSSAYVAPAIMWLR